VKGPAVE
jgi:hypothetical protein